MSLVRANIVVQTDFSIFTFLREQVGVAIPWVVKIVEAWRSKSCAVINVGAPFFGKEIPIRNSSSSLWTISRNAVISEREIGEIVPAL